MLRYPGRESTFGNFPEIMVDQEESVNIEMALKRQADRIGELRKKSTLVLPKYQGKAILDSSIESLYELSSVSATRSYLRFIETVSEVDLDGLPIIGSLVHDWAVTGDVRSDQRVVATKSGTLLLRNVGDLDIIASSSVRFRKIFEAFTDFRREASSLNYDEFGGQPFSVGDDAQYVQLIRKFWSFVAAVDPMVLDSGSQFWSQHTSVAATWIG